MAANRWAPWVALSTPDVLLPYTIISWVMHAEEGMHPWGQLTVRYYMSPGYQVAAAHLPPSLWWAENTPVKITWGATRANSAEFTGYVVSPELLATPEHEQQQAVMGNMITVRYTLLGASKILQSAVTRFWKECTVAYMAQQIAATNGLTAVIDPHPRVFNRMQASQSDFHFLQDRAAEVGYRLSVDNTTLYLTRPSRPLVSSQPELRQSRMPGMADTMQAFHVVAGETDPAGEIRATHTSVALTNAGVLTASSASAPRLDPVTGLPVAPQISRFASAQVTSSWAEANAVTQAAALAGLWWVHATATTDGDVRLRPGCVVTVSGSALPDQYQGAWMTRSAHHRVVLHQLDPTLSTYYVDVDLGRDQLTELNTTSYVAPAPTRSAVVGQRWSAQRTVVR